MQKLAEHLCSCQWWLQCLKLEFTSHYKLLSIYYIGSSGWEKGGQAFRQILLPECWPLTPSDHPHNHRLRWQNPADVDRTLIIGRFCSAGDLLLRPASCESNTLQHQDWLHFCPHICLKLKPPGAGTMIYWIFVEFLLVGCLVYMRTGIFMPAGLSSTCKGSFSSLKQRFFWKLWPLCQHSETPFAVFDI